MQAYDLIMLIVLAATTIFGAIKGFAWQVASLASIVASYVVAYLFRNDVAKMINAQPPWNLFLAMLLLYFGSSLIIWMLFRLVSTSIDKVKLKDFDRQLGAGFGMIKGVALCLIITMFAMTLLGAAQQQRIANSRSGLYISRILANAGGILPTEIKQIVGPYIDNVEQKLHQNQNGLLPQAGDGLLDGLGQMVQQRVNQFGNEVRNGQMPTNFMPEQGGGQPNQANGGFFGAGQGGQNPAPVSNQGWGNFNNAPPQPTGWPVSQQQQPQQQPPPINNNWQNGFQNGFDNNSILPR
ncbi:MAG: CvpA family protein [Planctomycetota bacterium]|jgi:membrane protein required for colicin V production|nr:CvpA family protein [Planctomycetota bacterium]